MSLSTQDSRDACQSIAVQTSLGSPRIGCIGTRKCLDMLPRTDLADPTVKMHGSVGLTPLHPIDMLHGMLYAPFHLDST